MLGAFLSGKIHHVDAEIDEKCGICVGVNRRGFSSSDMQLELNIKVNNLFHAYSYNSRFICYCGIKS